MSENKNTPLVSVLMAVYNCADTLDEAIQTIIDQTYTNWELILYDDCSSDNTYSKCLEHAEKDPRIKAFKNEKNLTLAPTLNNCLKQAKGVYTARMDGDDVCDPTRFEKQVKFLNEHPEYAVVSCIMDVYDENGVFGTIKFPEKPDKEFLGITSPVCHAGCMMRKEVLQELGGYDASEEINRIEDYDLWFRLYKAGYKAYNIQEALYSMRDDRNALKRRSFKNRVNEYKLRVRICKAFKLPVKYRLMAFRPIILGFLPAFVYTALHKKNSKHQLYNDKT